MTVAGSSPGAYTQEFLRQAATELAVESMTISSSHRQQKAYVHTLLDFFACEALLEPDARQLFPLKSNVLQDVRRHLNRLTKQESARLSSLIPTSGSVFSSLAARVDRELRAEMAPRHMASQIKLGISYFAEGVVSSWKEHGGQNISPALNAFFRLAADALSRGADPSSGDWDIQLHDGRIHRPAATEVRASLFQLLARRTLALAQEHFTYALMVEWSPQQLDTLLLNSIRKAKDDVRLLNTQEQALESARGSLHEWQKLHPCPLASPYGVSAVGAEHWCRDWLKHMGLEGAEVTQQSNDGGIDITSPTHIAQVKHYAGSVDIAAIREFIGVAAVDGRKPLFMTSGQYSAQAPDLADRAGMPLFHYDVATAKVSPCNESADRICRGGFFFG